MKHVLILFTLTMVATSARAQDVTGDWQGTLNTGMGDLRLVLHLAKAGDGSLTATLDSVDQGANGIPVKSATLKDSKLKLDVEAVHGTYEGSVAADGKSISGTWSQGKPLPLEFKRAAAPIKTEHKAAKPSDIDGSWAGTLDTGMAKLRVVFHIVNTEDGLIATMDSPDQDTKNVPTTSCSRDGAILKIDAKNISASFEGKIAADLQSMDGTFTQMGTPHPLLLKKVKGQAELDIKRPQVP